MPLIYLPEPNAVLLHLPKSGGLSIRGKPSEKIKGCWPGRRVVTNKHIPENFPMDRCFGCHRHPLTHFLSGYHFFLKKYAKHPKKWNINMAINVLENDAIRIIGRRGKHNKQRMPCLLKHHIAPHTSPEFRSHLVKHWLAFENYEEDFRRLCTDFLNVPIPELPHNNKAPGPRDWRSELSDVQLTRLVSIYINDFEFFGYPIPDIRST